MLGTGIWQTLILVPVLEVSQVQKGKQTQHTIKMQHERDCPSE